MGVNGRCDVVVESPLACGKMRWLNTPPRWLGEKLPSGRFPGIFLRVVFTPTGVQLHATQAQTAISNLIMQLSSQQHRRSNNFTSTNPLSTRQHRYINSYTNTNALSAQGHQHNQRRRRRQQPPQQQQLSHAPRAPRAPAASWAESGRQLG